MARRNFSYDAQGRVTSVSNLLGNTNLASFDYDYDCDNATGQLTVLGQRTKVTARVPSICTVLRTEYFYDANSQLIRERITGAYTSDRSWTYDAIGNRLAELTSGVPTSSYSYVKNGANPNNSTRLATAGPASATYDVKGNTSLFGGTTHQWDVLNRLKSVTPGAATFNFTYDGLDRRTRIADSAPAKFIYEGQNLVDVAYRQGAGYFRANYLFAPGIDQPLARADNIGVTYYSVDGLGSVILLTDGAGAVKNKYGYGAWGELNTRDEQLVQPFLYTAREATVLGSAQLREDYYYRARYMKSRIGRFLSEDPIGFEEGVNFYAYAYGNPVVWIDPEGLAAQAYNPYKKCIADAVKKCNGIFRFICDKFGGYDGDELKRLTKKCADTAKVTCQVVPNKDVPSSNRRQYDKDIDKFKDKCEKSCPPKKFDCDGFLNCIAKQKP